MLRFPDFSKRRRAATTFGVGRDDRKTAAKTLSETAGVRVALDTLVRLSFQAQGLSYPPRQRMTGPLTGGYRSVFRGRGMEFEEVRPYQPGDDIRNMDWRVTARTGEPHTKLFQEERERATFFMVDLNPSMAFGTRNMFKSVAAIRAAALLAWAAMANGDRVGGMAMAPGAKLFFQPAAGSRGVLPLLKSMVDQQPEPAANRTPLPLADGLRRLRTVARPGSLIFLFSDFMTLDPNAEQQISRLSQHNDLVLAFVWDPLEARLPGSGHFSFSDGSATITVEGADHDRAHRQRFSERRQTVRQLCRGNRALFADLATEESADESLRHGLGTLFRKKTA